MLAIKQTLYRTSGDSPIVDALIDAAEAGKQVLVLVEIKARFDEQANIQWARKLEQAGCHVVYGLVGLKTHCKLSLVVRDEPDGLRRYAHVGTGNYNPKTARLYEDLGLLTADAAVGERRRGPVQPPVGLHAAAPATGGLLVAPESCAAGCSSGSTREIQHHLAGRPGDGIPIKVNSLVDEAVIDALYRASRAGVPVDLWVRGICALRPGVPGLSETIRVRSILGRFLEHCRIFLFAQRRRRRGLDRLRRPDAPQPGPPGRGARATEGAGPRHRARRAVQPGLDEGTGSWWLHADDTWQPRLTGPDGEPCATCRKDSSPRVGDGEDSRSIPIPPVKS